MFKNTWQSQSASAILKKVYMRAKNNLSGIGENAPVPKIFATFET